MTKEGRDILYRVEIRCSEFWAKALADRQRWPAPPTTDAVFGQAVWYGALYRVNRLRMGFSVKEGWQSR